MVKLNLGSANRKLHGYIGVDIEPSENVDIVARIENLDMFESNTIDEIYCSHAFEYFDRFQAADVLQEWIRVLKPNGSIYISVPDFDALVQIYSETNDLEKIIGPLFGRWLNTKNGNVVYHKTVWNNKKLTELLQSCGLSEIKTFSPIDFLSNIDPKYDDFSLAFFPHMNQDGIQVSLCLTGIKI